MTRLRSYMVFQNEIKYKRNFFSNLYKTSVRTSQQTHCISAIEANRLMVLKENNLISCENYTNFSKLNQVVHIVTLEFQLTL
jgi:hypothetical protein